MIKSISGKLFHLVIAVVLLQSCERETEIDPLDEESSLAKKWYAENGEPFVLEWSKSETIKVNNETTTIIVPLKDGLNLGSENGSLQNMVFTVEKNAVLTGNKVDLVAERLIVGTHSKEAISNFIKRHGHNNPDWGKVYFMTYDLKNILISSHVMDAKELKSIHVQLTAKETDTKGKIENENLNNESSNSSSSSKIPVVCKDWYLVEYFDDGTAEWAYLYTTCSGTASSGGGGNSGGGGGASGGANTPSATNFNALAPVEAIDIYERLDCFSSVPSNADTTYKITLHGHSAHNGYPTQEFWDGEPGHAYITLEKSNGSNVQRLSFGFYPKVDTWVTPTKNAVASGIGEESSNGERNSNIRLTSTINASAFNNAVSKAKTASNKPYDLNDYNCTDYAVDVFNASQNSNGQLIVPNSNIGFTTPAGLYKTLDEMRIGGNTNISNTLAKPPVSTNCN